MPIPRVHRFRIVCAVTVLSLLAASGTVWALTPPPAKANISLTLVNPNAGSRMGGATVEIYGANFPILTSTAPADITSGYVIRAGIGHAISGGAVAVPLTLYRGDDAIAAGEAAAAIQFDLLYDATKVQFASAQASPSLSVLYHKGLTASPITGGQRIVIWGLNEDEITSYSGATLIRPFPLGTMNFNIVGDPGESSALQVTNVIAVAGDAAELTMDVGQDGIIEIHDPSSPPNAPIVTFGGNAATVQEWTASTITALTPASAVSGPVDVRVGSPYDAGNFAVLAAGFSYYEAEGSLQVTLAPAAAIAAGAQWRIDGGEWQNSSVTLAGLPAGAHVVSYKEIPDWDEPADKTLTVFHELTTNWTDTYTEHTGSLQVTLLPAGAVSAGAQWRVDGGTWQNSGAIQADIPIGDHTVSYKETAGWDTPADRVVTITHNITAPISATYVAASGSLKVTIFPEAAAAAGAQWRVDDGAWQNSGVTVAGIPEGVRALSFKDASAAGWVRPNGRGVTIVRDLLTEETATYTETGTSSGCVKSVKRLDTTMAEEVLPLSLDAAPDKAIVASASPAVRLSSEKGIETASVWALLESENGPIAGAALWLANPAETGDGWVEFTTEAPLPAGQLITLTAGALDLDGGEIVPVSEQFIISTAKTANVTNEPSVTDEPGIAPLHPLLASPASTVYRVGPAGVFDAPLAVRIPVPEDASADDLAVYYFSESERHQGWYRGVNVTGWMLPDSLQIVEEEDQVFMEIQVNHSGVLQIGHAFTVKLGSVSTVDVGASGAPGQWAALAGALLVLSLGLGALWRRRAV